MYRKGRKVEIHTAKWHRCVRAVKRAASANSPYGVCTASIGQAGSYLKRPRPKRTRVRRHNFEEWRWPPPFGPRWRKERWSDREGRYVPVPNPRSKASGRGRKKVTTTTTTTRTKQTKREANPTSKRWKIWVHVRGRTWHWYTPDQETDWQLLGDPATYTTRKEAEVKALWLRDHTRWAKWLRSRTMAIARRRPTFEPDEYGQ